MEAATTAGRNCWKGTVDFPLQADARPMRSGGPVIVLDNSTTPVPTPATFTTGGKRTSLFRQDGNPASQPGGLGKIIRGGISGGAPAAIPGAFPTAWPSPTSSGQDGRLDSRRPRASPSAPRRPPAVPALAARSRTDDGKALVARPHTGTARGRSTAAAGVVPHRSSRRRPPAMSAHPGATPAGRRTADVTRGKP